MCPSSATAATAIFRRACSPADGRDCTPARSGRGAPWKLVAACLAGVLAGAARATPLLEIGFGRVVHPSIIAEGVVATLGAEGEVARIFIRSLQPEGRVSRIADVTMTCGRLRLAQVIIECLEGSLEIPVLGERSGFDIAFDTGDRTGRVKIDSPQVGRVDLTVGTHAILTELYGLPLDRLPQVFAASSSWSPSGRMSGRVEYDFGPGRRLKASIRLDSGGFASADGLRAAEGVELAVDLVGRGQARTWNWDADIVWSAGEAYLDPFYLASGARLHLAARSEGDRVDLQRVSLNLDGVEEVKLSGELDLGAGMLRSGALALKGADLAVLGPSFILPAVAPAQQGLLTVEGTLDLVIGVADGTLSALEIGLDEVRIARSDGSAKVGPTGGAVAWYSDRAGELAVHVAGGRWRSLDFGAFDLRAKLDARSVELAAVRIPLLDGAVVFESVALVRGSRGWQGGGAAVVEPVSMPLLTEALGLPRMAGVLSASIPGLIVRPGEVVLDGALVISVFGGYLQASRLHLFEPFGRFSRLEADIEARAIDLTGLTETFSFGSISGLIDADVTGLELVQWRPQRFDASVRSSPGRYPRRISQRAVQNISALGGPGAALAIQRGVLGFFESFGYRSLAIGCRLENAVCTMTGIGGSEGVRENGSFVLVEGGGVPALNVIGYNRRIDWNEFLDRLQRVIASNAAPVVQ